MMRVLACALFVASSCAFVIPPASRASILPLRVAKLDSASGVSAPVGFWDPLGLVEGLGPDDSKFQFFRAAEAKHARVGMLAVIGYIVPYYFRLPGEIAGTPIADYPAGVDALTALPLAGILQIVLAMSILENGVFYQKPENAGGNIWGDLWVKHDSDASRTELETKELNNGRLAMLSTIALIVQDKLSDAPFPLFGAFQ